MWIVLFLSAGILFVFMLFFADSGESAVVQATMMGGVTVLVASLLLLLWFLDNPYRGDVGALKPAAMQSTLEVLQQEAEAGRRCRGPVRRGGLADGGHDLLSAHELGAIGALFSIGGANPWWSLAIFFLCVWVVYGILVLGDDERVPAT